MNTLEERERGLANQTFRIVPHLRESASWNLAVEEALLLKAKQKLKEKDLFDPIIHLYSFDRPTVVLGYDQKISEIDFPYCREHDVHVTMRKTGGGSVFLSAEEMQYGLIIRERYTRNLLKSINQSLRAAFQDIGVNANLTEKDGHEILRYEKRGFVFDAQKRIVMNTDTPGVYDHLLLHHGTILVDNANYESMPKALKADQKDMDILQKGNIWLREKAQVKSQELIKALNRNLAKIGATAKVKDLTRDEVKLARKLHRDHYNDPTKWSDGNKKFGICYRTDTSYDMEQYAETEEVKD